jgi:hypothetical protein
MLIDALENASFWQHMLIKGGSYETKHRSHKQARSAFRGRLRRNACIQPQGRRYRPDVQ